MTFLASESSVEGSEPREGIEIILPAETIRISTGTRDIVINSETYTATPTQRAELVVPRANDDSIVNLMIDRQHSLVSRYMRGHVPPRSILVNVYRRQGADYECVWRGRITAVRFDGDLAVFSMPSRLLLLVDRRLPTFSVSKRCPHTLYATGTCKVTRASFKVTTTITLVNGRTISVAGIGGNPDNWAQFGELVHVASGEPMTIAEQVGTQLTIPAPIGGMNTGDSVEIYAGCDRLVATCHTKFSNRVHFGMFPQLNDENIPVPPGFGVAVSA